MENLDFILPENWQQIAGNVHWSSALFALLSDPEIPVGHVPVLFAFRTNGIKILDYQPAAGCAIIKFRGIYQVSSMELAPIISSLEWLKGIPDVPVRLAPPNGRKSLRPDLADIDFQTYLTLENLYQGYLHTKSDDMLKRMGAILYPRKFSSLRKLRRQHLFSCFFWFMSFKNWAAHRWSDFFVSASDSVSLSNPAAVLRDAVDAQIRALTKGDITKEKIILGLPCHRALTELNALARESAELKQKLKK